MMTAAHDTFLSRRDAKRKRTFDSVDEPDICQDRQAKRRLPIRLTPASPQDQPWHDRFSGFNEPLTPADSSDEEANGQAENSWGRRYTSTVSSRRLQPNGITVNVDTVDDEDMDMCAPPPVNPHPSFTKHNNLSIFVHRKFLSAPAISLDERMPTPITDSFQVYGDKPKARTWKASRPTILSPVMGEELSFPSPISLAETVMDMDPETVMRMEHTSNGLGALSVACDDDHMMMEDNAGATRDSTTPLSDLQGTKSTRNHGRNAKLHMGFRADCDKCQQRVPGHYSHIVWT